ncbi:tetraacyldisaccharide 4'-kinase [Pinirhizobacter sp.]|jgi:tetraacyldisaccharide 4'-kinase|uniref:tetraacyldisaccharide 4'-kinase n=1 Tax=Pinirhizobacter sp. TaxID=2950432 RepID=UPI002F3E2D83
MSLATRLQQRWYSDLPPLWWTLPLEALYRSVSSARARKASPVRIGVPVIVVGNITAGGTGKTPLTLAIVDELRARGMKPGVVSRGYGGSQVEPALLPEGATARQYGDEPALMRQAGALVAVGRDRPAAARLLVEHGCDVVVADDGLQHLRLARDVEICVIDGARRFGNGRLLPAGPLREPVTRLATVDFVVCNGGTPWAHEIPMSLTGNEAQSLVDSSRHLLLEYFRGRVVHAVAGIGNPGRFFQGLRKRGIEVIEHPFPDHHDFIPGDIVFGDGHPVLMTTKDGMKCRAFATPEVFVVPVTAHCPGSFYDRLVGLISPEGKGD